MLHAVITLKAHVSATSHASMPPSTCVTGARSYRPGMILQHGHVHVHVNWGLSAPLSGVQSRTHIVCLCAVQSVHHIVNATQHRMHVSQGVPSSFFSKLIWPSFSVLNRVSIASKNDSLRGFRAIGTGCRTSPCEDSDLVEISTPINVALGHLVPLPVKFGVRCICLQFVYRRLL